MGKKAVLVILDGWGLGVDEKADAVKAANTPIMDGLYEKYPHNTLVTHGLEVGLPEGQMGNSEVGHLNIGAGRIVYQDFAKINKSLADGTLPDEKTIKELVSYCKDHQKPIHLMGLLSDGGVHSHINHIFSLIDIFDSKGIAINLHLYLDGRDTDPKGGLGYLKDTVNHIKGKNATIVSVVGRYYALDRDLRWERIQKAYDVMVKGVGEKTNDILSSVQSEYDNGKTDEFMPAFILDSDKCMKNGDAVLFFNFRTDRPRQITRALTQEDFPEQGMQKLDLKFASMTRYSASFKGVDVVFDKEPLEMTLGEVISGTGLSQVRIAETEKYPHVTFFFSGGKEEEVQGEKRILIPSPKVATYDLQPEMSAPELNTAIIEEMISNKPDFVCLNYANADMVGHTGDFGAVIKAVETVDQCLGELIEVGLADDYEFIVIADHGNSDFMINADGSPNTAHTTNLVPVVHVSKEPGAAIQHGKLADVAPTILKIMGVPQPKEMTGTSLL